MAEYETDAGGMDNQGPALDEQTERAEWAIEKGIAWRNRAEACTDSRCNVQTHPPVDERG